MFFNNKHLFGKNFNNKHLSNYKKNMSYKEIVTYNES